MIGKMKIVPEREKFLLEMAGVSYRHSSDFYVYTGNKGIIGDWEIFGILIEWGQKERWWPKFKHKVIGEEGVTGLGPLYYPIQECFIDPELFANALYKFLKEEPKI